MTEEEAELAELQAKYDDLTMRNIRLQGVCKLKDALLADMQLDLDALRADVSRYQWIKANDPYGCILIAWRHPKATAFERESLDRAVDYARGALQ